MEPNVLFFRLKQSRMRPSHSLKLIGGSGLRGSIRTTDESTFGGGLKLFLPTWIRQYAHKKNSIQSYENLIYKTSIQVPMLASMPYNMIQMC